MKNHPPFGWAQRIPNTSNIVDDGRDALDLLADDPKLKNVMTREVEMNIQQAIVNIDIDRNPL